MEHARPRRIAFALGLGAVAVACLLTALPSAAAGPSRVPPSGASQQLHAVESCARDGSRLPTIFIHGLFSDALGAWGAAFDGLEAAGLCNGGVITAQLPDTRTLAAPVTPEMISLSPANLPAADFYGLAFLPNDEHPISQIYALQKAVQAVRDATQADRVILVGHSLGGVSGRAYLHAFRILGLSQHGVAKLITVAAPHAGTDFSRTDQVSGEPERLQRYNTLIAPICGIPGIPFPCDGGEFFSSVFGAFTGSDGRNDIFEFLLLDEIQPFLPIELVRFLAGFSERPESPSPALQLVDPAGPWLTAMNNPTADIELPNDVEYVSVILVKNNPLVNVLNSFLLCDGDGDGVACAASQNLADAYQANLANHRRLPEEGALDLFHNGAGNAPEVVELVLAELSASADGDSMNDP